MEVKEALQKRRSVRKFTDAPVPEEAVDALLHAAMSGPSACNKAPWEFWVITREEALQALKGASRFTNYEGNRRKRESVQGPAPAAGGVLDSGLQRGNGKYPPAGHGAWTGGGLVRHLPPEAGPE